VSNLNVLFSMFGSAGDVDATSTLFVMVPFLVGLTTILTVAVPPLAKVPRLQVTCAYAGFTVQVP
jgi:hypothetical protein